MTGTVMGMSFVRSEQLNRLVLRPNERIYTGRTLAAAATVTLAENDGASTEYDIAKIKAPRAEQESSAPPVILPE